MGGANAPRFICRQPPAGVYPREGGGGGDSIRACDAASESPSFRSVTPLTACRCLWARARIRSDCRGGLFWAFKILDNPVGNFTCHGLPLLWIKGLGEILAIGRITRFNQH